MIDSTYTILPAMQTICTSINHNLAIKCACNIISQCQGEIHTHTLSVISQVSHDTL